MTEKKILVVEDNPLNLKLVRCLLQIAHYSVLEASEAESGIHLAVEKQPDLILMDLQLPGMDGLSATRKLKSLPETKDIPIVALTSYAMNEDKKEAMGAGCAGYLTKPIDTKTFPSLVSQFFPQKKDEPASDAVHTAGFQHRILIVEDDPQSAKMIEALLPADEYHSYIVESGNQALAAVADTPPDLILLDILMPGMDGYEVARRIKSAPESKHIPIIMISSLNGTEDKLRGIEAGTDEFLTKPIRPTELLARIRSLVRMKRYREQVLSRQLTEKRLLSDGFETEGMPSVPESTPHILIVDDNEKDIKLLKSQLEGEAVSISWVNNGEDALAACFSKRVDILLLDLILPGIDGYEVCRRLKNDARTRNIQILLITNLDDFHLKIKGIESGADDYLIKPAQNVELTVRVRSLIKKKNYIDQLIANSQAVTHQAVIDGATGLYSYLYFKYFADLEIERCQRREQPMTLISIFFESTTAALPDTDSLEGDSILKTLGLTIKKGIRKIDLAARISPTQFSVLLPYSDRSYSEIVVKRLSALIREQFFTPSDETYSKGFRIRFGAASYPTDGKTLSELLIMADRPHQKSQDRSSADIIGDLVKGDTI